MLQALKDEPPLNAKCKDKFLIQSTIITPDKDTLPLQDIVSRLFLILRFSFLTLAKSGVARTRPKIRKYINRS